MPTGWAWSSRAEGPVGPGAPTLTVPGPSSSRSGGMATPLPPGRPNAGPAEVHEPPAFAHADGGGAIDVAATDLPRPSGSWGASAHGTGGPGTRGEARLVRFMGENAIELTMLRIALSAHPDDPGRPGLRHHPSHIDPHHPREAIEDGLAGRRGDSGHLDLQALLGRREQHRRQRALARRLRHEAPVAPAKEEAGKRPAGTQTRSERPGSDGGARRRSEALHPSPAHLRRGRSEALRPPGHGAWS